MSYLPLKRCQRLDLAEISIDDGQSSVAQKLDSLSHSDRIMNLSMAVKTDELRKGIQSVLEGQGRLQKQSDYLLTSLASLAEEAKRVDYGQRILYSLRYEQMRARQNAVAESYADTYEWIFDADQQSKFYPRDCQNSFVNWLRSGGGIYWVSGKAGSGKSTLMKFLCGHESTRSILMEWVGNADLVVAEHFFWLAGYALQKSELGLLRRLCFDVFRQCPDLMPIVCKEIWHSPKGPDDDSESWTLASLYIILDRVKKQLLQSGGRAVRFCFFIDGLDEYKGEHRDLLNILCKLSSSPDIKICVSSRPWNTIQNVLGRDPCQMLTLQDLTRNDIHTYVKGHLEVDEHFVHMASQGTSCDEIITEITEKAQGVFLWVFLVVKLMLRGLENGDSLNDLQRRLKQLPPDLETYFQQMFDTLDEFYEERTAQTFLVCLAAEAPLPLLGFAALESRDLLAARMCGKEHVNLVDVLSLQAQLKKRINASCRDLVEVHAESNDTMLNPTYVVDFLHRTVRDFLHATETVHLLQARAGDEFHPVTARCDISLATARRTQHLRSGAAARLRYFGDQVLCLVHYAHRLEAEEHKTPAETLDHLREYMVESTHAWAQALLARSESRCNDLLSKFDLFVCFCAMHNLVIYMKYLLASNPSLLGGELGHLCLATVIDNIMPNTSTNEVENEDKTEYNSTEDDSLPTPFRISPGPNPGLDTHDESMHAIRTIELLVSNGVDINERRPKRLYPPAPTGEKQTFWEWYLQFLAQHSTRMGRERHGYVCITETLLNAGPHDTCEAKERAVFEQCFGDDDMVKLMRTRRCVQANLRSSWNFFRWPYG